MLFLLVGLAYLALLATGWLGLRLAKRKGWLAAPVLLLSCVGVVLLTAGLLFSGMYVEWLWQDSLGHGDVYERRIFMQALLVLGSALVGGVVTWWTLRWPFALEVRGCTIPEEERDQQLESSGLNSLKTLGALAHWGLVLVAMGVFGWYGAAHWSDLLLMINSEPTGTVDPIFGKDLQFWFFQLPIYQDLIAIMLWGSVIALAVTAIYAGIAGTILNDTFGKDVTLATMKPLSLYATPRIALIALLWCCSVYFGRYEVMFNEGDHVVGVDVVENDVKLRVRWFEMAAIALVGLGCIGIAHRKLRAPGVLVTALGTVGLVGTYVIGYWLVGGIYWGFFVKPSEQVYQQPYIEHHMAMTHKAYGLDKAEVQAYSPNYALTLDDLKRSPETLQNVRLWDTRALGPTLGQLQGLTSFFRFEHIDVDRYTIDGRSTSVMIASREIDQSKLASQAKEWQNKHLFYTHGYGLCLVKPSETEPNGHPKLHIRGVPPVSDLPELKITRPEIYFGRLTTEHCYVNTTLAEFDFPRESETATSHYAGTGGVPIGPLWSPKRWALALHFDSTKGLMSGYLTPESRLMWRREIVERIRGLAPFLRWEDHPYKVIHEGRLVYMIDGYTTSTRFPYARSVEKGALNYIRNSVKAVIDAYDGSVQIYVFDESCPIIKAWRKTFPSLFKPWNEMPDDLKAHARYPEQLLKIQAEIWGDFHMSPNQYFRREDRWEVAHEAFQDDVRHVEPYGITCKLPGKPKEEFLVMLPFSPRGPDENPKEQKDKTKKHIDRPANAIGWMAGRSDGENCGKLLIYSFPRDRQIWGPMQIESRIDGDERMSQDLALWRRNDSEIIRGNQLMIPIEGGLLYVEPIFLKAARSPMPELARVVVAFGDRLAWGKTFDEALAAAFGQRTSTPPVVPDPLPPNAGDLQFRTRARELYERYLKLMGERKPAEAGATLDELGKLLREGR